MPIMTTTEKANFASKNANNIFIKAQRGEITILPYSAAVSINFASNNRHKLTLTASGATMSAPTNVVAGQGGIIYIVQTAGGDSLPQESWNSVYKFLEDYTLDETPNAVNIFAYETLDSTHIAVSYIGSY